MTFAPVVVQLPAGIQCKGGNAGNLCLMSFKTTSGFGNCAVVSQGAATSTGAAKTAATATSDTAAAAVAAGASTAKADANDASSLTFIFGSFLLTRI